MWPQAVTFRTEKNSTITVKGPVEALRILDGWWQKYDGPAYRDAINVCIEAIQGERPSDDARRAFMMALTEGGVMVDSH
ncbi:DUF982 domain-containing protein [Paracoccus sp. (in: a-proteobacteria)]|uniref:DUF982 domain-containing protein n=1 Tax=Paracoccus sp. TaxID=267 RepID=UPI00396D0008